MNTTTTALDREYPIVDSERTRPRRASARTVVAPPPRERAPLWDRPVPASTDSDGRAPLVWLLGAHGGAGVTTLEQLLAPAADCQRRWPAVLSGESPYVLVVARETVTGLAAADALLRQHHAGLAGSSEVVGLITVAVRPGRIPAQIRRDRALYVGLVEHAWRVDWHEALTLARTDMLPVWTPTSAPATTRRPRDDLATVPVDVRAVGEQVVAVITERESQHSRNGGPR